MSDKMRTALFTGKGKVEIKEFPIPKCDDDKLLVKIEACALCTWEQRVYKGTHNVQYPVIGGHEVAGRIVEVGKELLGLGWEVGEKVVVGSTMPCGSCIYCQSHNEQNCISFDTLNNLPGQPHPGTGGMSEYMMHQPRSVFKYYHVTPQEAALIEPLSCVVHSIETANPQFGDFSVVIGAGIMGLFHTQLCVRKGNCVIVIDMNEERLKLALEMGATHVINPSKEDAEKRILEITHGLKANNVFDTTPIAEVAEDAVKYIANCGKLVIYSGIYPNKPITVDPHWIHKKAIQVLGTANSSQQDFVRASSMISNGIINVKPLISGTYSVYDAEKALESACQGDKFRNVIMMDFKD